MAFFCAGGAGQAKKSKGSRPQSKNTAITPSGQKISAESPSQAPLPTIPHSNSIDLPHMRRMIVVQEYKPQDNQGLAVQRGESVQVINQDGDWMYVRNERKKEGFVPTPYLVAPYTSTRSRTSSRSNGTNAIRAVSSGSSVESSPRLGVVPMTHSQSADRPRVHSADRDQELRESRLAAVRRVASPPGPTTTSVAMNHDHHNNSHTTSYEQKHSPSSSSGVASLNGPSSPSFASLHQSTSQENFNHSSESSLNRSPDGRSAKSSLSSIEVPHDGAERPVFPSAVSPVFNHHLNGARNGGLSSEETVSRGKATSESNLTSLKVTRYPTPPRNEPPPSRPPIRPRHVYTEVRDESPPPPVPPRNIPGSHSSATQGDTYSQPVDAINGYKEHIPGLEYPRVRTCSLTDVRPRETPIVNNTQYSAVFTGRQKPPNKLLIHRHHNGSPASSETESPRSSRHSSASKKSCSLTRNRRLDDGMHYVPREKMPRVPGASTEDHGKFADKSSLSSQTKISKFRRCLWGLFIVTEDFEAMDENEVSVKKGEHVSVWNQDDREWYWVVKHTRNYSEEGLVPSCLLCEASNESKSTTSLETLNQRNPSITLSTASASSPKQPRTPTQLHLPDRTPPPRTRPRLSSTGHDTRPMTSVPLHRPSSGSVSHRQRLGSDSSSHSTSKVPRTSSSVSIEKEDIPESPPSSPPPPYSEVDNNPRHASFSLSQQPNGSAGGSYAASMHRTRSHGQVSSPAYLIRARATVQQLPSPMADPSRTSRSGSTGSRDAHTPLSQGVDSRANTQSGTLV